MAGDTEGNVAVTRLLPGGQLDSPFAPGAGADDLDAADGRLEISCGGSADTGIHGERDVLVRRGGTTVVAGLVVVPEGGRLPPTSPRTRSSSPTAGSCSPGASRSPSRTSWWCA